MELGIWALPAKSASKRSMKMQTWVYGLGFEGLLGPSNVVPSWVWYGFLLGLLVALPKRYYIGGSR